MANKICYPLTKIPEYLVEKVKVPTGATYYGGTIVMCEVLDTNIAGNREVYAGSTITDPTTQVPCIIINGGFEQLADGRRPDGNPNPATFSFGAGDVATAIRLTKNLKFFISNDAVEVGINPAIAVGVKLVATDESNVLTTAAAVGTNAMALNVEKLEGMGIGGQFGMSFANGSIARVVAGN